MFEKYILELHNETSHLRNNRSFVIVCSKISLKTKMIMIKKEKKFGSLSLIMTRVMFISGGTTTLKSSRVYLAHDVYGTQEPNGN